MFIYQVYFKENNTWNLSDDWIRPFHDTETLDESLDSGTMRIACVRREEPYLPFTRMKIEVYQDDVLKETIHRLVLSDLVTTKRMRPFPLYDHDLQTIELTKMLERDICDSMTVTNYLGHDYGEGEFEIEAPEFENTGNSDIKDITTLQKTPDLYGPISKKNLPKRIQVPIFVVKARFGFQPTTDIKWLPAKIKVISPSGKTFYFNDGNTYARGEFNDKISPTLYYDLTELGTYQFVIEYFGQGSTVPIMTYTCTTSIGVFASIPSYTDWTITDVVERLLSAGITRRNGIDTQKYILDRKQAEQFKKIKAPEFFFTRSTLFEALMTVGGYIHAIPRLIDEKLSSGQLTVHFDMLGGSDTYQGTLPGFTYQESSIDAENYCGGLDSPVQNLLNTIDRTAGAITDPDDGDYKTLRTEQGQVEISEDTGIITTDMPIYQITDVKCSVPIDGAAQVVDITPYIYEAAEYDALSSYWGQTFPYSKAFALRYSQGDNKITELNAKIQHATSAGSGLAQISIKNILQAKGINVKGLNVINLGFSVTYIPIVNSRVTAKKTLYKKDRNDNYRIYNQSGNTVESEYYGANMKGVLARIGNQTYRRTYLFKNYDDIPKCGQIVDGMYVSLVEKEYEQLWIKATITLTPNFNKLAEFIGVNSNVRMYDISEKQSVDRYINYGETCLISHKKFKCGSPTITPKGIASYVKMFGVTVPGVSTSPVFAADIITYAGREASSTNIKQAARVGQTCVSYALGNSMCFTVQMADNYGAGYQANDSYEGEPNKRANRLVRYSDALGNVSYIRLSLGSGLWRPTAASQTSEDGEANLFPELTYKGDNPYWVSLFDTTGGNLFISKDSRERLILTYQLHNQTDNENIVLGEMLTLHNMLINGYNAANKLAVYFLPHTINELDKKIDLTGSWQAKNFAINYDGKSDFFSMGSLQNDSSSEAQSWALVDEATSRLYIGENLVVRPGGYTDTLYFNFMDNAALEKFETA